MLVLLAVHAVAAVLAPLAVRRWGRSAFALLALVPAGCAVWLVLAADGVTAGAAVDERTSWVPSVGMALAFRLDALSLATALLVTVVGAIVLAYCARYFRETSPALGRFAGVLVGFAGAMLGLVLADDMLVLYVCWELTTVFSYLLIGQHEHLRKSRRAASQALIVTTAGGLAMLVGIIMLGEHSGSYLLSDLVAAPPSGPLVTTALVLVLVGALSKSALLPFHFWLPAAMAAPTPVSAYLHAAAMVKAGVYLVARLSPAFADAPGWRPLTIGLGLLTMLVGGWLALQQHDLKLLLAYGTVSQLGFLVLLAGIGTRETALAALAMLLAHGMFKAALFMTVGVIDRQTGTRDRRELSGLGRASPVLATVAVLAAASMAGLPPLAGFVAKESAFEALVHGGYADRRLELVVLVGVVVGTVLTVAYSALFVVGAFATKRGVAPLRTAPARASFLAAPAVLAVAGLAAGPLVGLVDPLVNAYAATTRAPSDEVTHLALWHGFTPALGLSVAAVALGLVLAWRVGALAPLQGRLGGGQAAPAAYDRTMRAVDRLSVEVTALTQRGSLPIYLGVILVTLVTAAGTAVVASGAPLADVVVWDTPVQGVAAVSMAVAAVAAARTTGRLTAVLLVGLTGYGMGVLFALQGAPDLALTQFLVETVTLVVFVLVLRKLPAKIEERHRRRDKRVRLAIAAMTGALVSVMLLVAIGARERAPVSDDLPDLAYDYGGGRNVVNVTLVDARAWDTLGEISVLVVAATGVASLVFLRRRTGRAPSPADASDELVKDRLTAPGRERPDAAPQVSMTARTSPLASWLSAGRLQASEHRVVLLEVITRLVFHTIVVASIYLLFAGHNVPGGGFAGGLVAGLALVLRYLAGGRYELGAAAPIDAGLVLGLGLLFAGGTGAVALVLGGEVLQTAIITTTLPLFDDVKLVTSLFFDIGVYLVVVGLVLDVLRSLGAEIDVQRDPERLSTGEPAEEPS